jgi:hypothetical protein
VDDRDPEVRHLAGGETNGALGVLLLAATVAFILPVIVTVSLPVVATGLLMVGMVVPLVVVTMPVVAGATMLILSVVTPLRVVIVRDFLIVPVPLMIVTGLLMVVAVLLVMAVITGAEFGRLAITTCVCGISPAAGTRRDEDDGCSDESQCAPVDHGLSSAAVSGWTPGSAVPVRRSSSAAAVW